MVLLLLVCVEVVVMLFVGEVSFNIGMKLLGVVESWSVRVVFLMVLI